MGRESLLPPRKRNWTKGIPQVGVFLRTPDGGVIEMSHDKASPDEVAFVILLIRGLKQCPEEIKRLVRAEEKEPACKKGKRE
jgi:hypothetical protein